MVKYDIDTVRAYTTYSSNWGRFIIRPFSDRMLWGSANYSNLTPNTITILGFLVGIASALCFLQATGMYFLVGAFLFELSYAIDCVDGGLARLKGMKSNVGMYLDNILDIVKLIVVMFGLAYGHYLMAGDITSILLGYGYVAISLIGFIQYLLLSKMSRVNADPEQNSPGQDTGAVSEARPSGTAAGTHGIGNIRRSVGAFLRARNISPYPTSTDTDALIFFIGPILLAFGYDFINSFIAAGSILMLGTLALVAWIELRQ